SSSPRVAAAAGSVPAMASSSAAIAMPQSRPKWWLYAGAAVVICVIGVIGLVLPAACTRHHRKRPDPGHRLRKHHRRPGLRRHAEKSPGSRSAAIAVFERRARSAGAEDAEIHGTRAG